MKVGTLTALANSGFYLYGFKAAGNSDLAGRPLVWLRMLYYAATTIVSCTDQYEAYISNSPIISNEEVVVATAAGIMPGQTLQISAGGSVAVLREGAPTSISILNTTSQLLTCGLSQIQNGTSMPFCAFPLNGDGLNVIAPLEKVLLIFSTVLIETGTVTDQSFSFAGPGAYSSGLLIDLNDDEQRQVSFDINEGWSWGAYTWGQQISSVSNLVPFLIDANAS
jgi:hypothetical protein